VNVYDLEVWQEVGALRPYKIKPVRLTKIKAETHINLLLTIEGDNMHYVPITSFNRLMFKQHSKHDHRSYFCQFCCHGFCRQDLLDKHLETGCQAMEGCTYELPLEGIDDEMKFEHM